MELNYAVVVLKTVRDLDYTEEVLECHEESLRGCDAEPGVRLLYISDGLSSIFIEKKSNVPLCLLTYEHFPEGTIYMVYDQVTCLEDISYVCQHPIHSELFSELTFSGVRFPEFEMLPNTESVRGMVKITLDDDY